MYNSLLLSTGGGIKPEMKIGLQSQSSIIVIGIGGTGIRALNTLKEKVYGKPETNFSKQRMSEDKHIQFIEIDSDLPNLPSSSFFHVSETGCIRQNGHTAIVEQAPKIYMKIKHTIVQTMHGLFSDKLTIHIIAGLSGGLGGGGFLDVCYIVRQLLENMHLEQSILCGYFFLPDIQMSTTNICNLGNMMPLLANSYASLTELDHFMNLQNEKIHFQQDYGKFHIKTTQPPVDLCHLISAGNDQWSSSGNSYQRCMNSVADYILHCESNYQNSANGFRKFSGNYLVFGLSTARFPMTKITTYLATGLYNKVRKYILRTPAPGQIDEFIDNQIFWILDAVKTSMIRFLRLNLEIPRPDIKTAKSVTHANIHWEEILKEPKFWLDENEKILNRNYTEMNGNITTWHHNPDCKSIIGKVFNMLYDYMISPEYGPGYVLGPGNYTKERFHSSLSQLYEKTHEELEQKIMLNLQQEHILEESAENFANSKDTLLNHKIEDHAYDEYRKQLEIFFKNKLDISIAEYTEKLILNLLSQIDKIYIMYLEQFHAFLKRLDQTFETNSFYFSNLEKSFLPDDKNTVSIVDFSELQPYLDKIIEKISLADTTSQMMEHFLECPDKWKSGNEENIYEMTSTFILRKFNNELEKISHEYLSEDFSDKISEVSRQLMLENIFKSMYIASDPPFEILPSDNMKIHSVTLLACPKNIAGLKTDAASLKQLFPKADLIECDTQNEIFMLRIYSGIPLDAYYLFTEMKQAYDSSNNTQRTIFKGDKKDV